MEKTKKSLLLGAIAGVIDVIPMIVQKLTWDANLSAFAFWIIAAFFISTTNIQLKGAIKGITIAMILLVPLAFLIAWNNPISLLPILIMTVILGTILGWSLEKVK
ncbi:MAG: hypothetical protein GW947_00080 [Candidatus Pacebacteria bacterium]|nr:hypothetical protein [Candidatus Paceibacterota bacterium]PIR60977.1 MAG: hypothetical protein COU68_01855 [Candidatus Pacebacteria bacterium CG10_big_fil_rev_8_21_14_0_10_45_6]